MEVMVIALVAGLFSVIVIFSWIGHSNPNAPQDGPEWGKQYEQTRSERDGL
jgi:hypothetical protein